MKEMKLRRSLRARGGRMLPAGTRVRVKRRGAHYELSRRGRVIRTFRASKFNRYTEEVGR